MENQKKAPLSGDYVKNYYNSFLKASDKSYTDHRWLGSVIGRAHFKQTKKAFQKVLGHTHYQHSLEIGGGDGLWTAMLLPHVLTLDFVDISEEMILRAKERFGNKSSVSFFCVDFLNFTSQKSYELIVSFRSFEYIENKQQAITQFASMLARKGTLILVTKSPYYDWRGYYKSHLLHTGQWSLGKVRTELEARGFKIIEMRPAIIGKKFDFWVMRILSLCIHFVCLYVPWQLLPFRILQYVSESFVIKCQKI